MFKIYSVAHSTVAYSTIAKLKLKLVYSLRLRFLKKRRRDVTYNAHDQHSTYTIKYNIQCIHISHCYFKTSTVPLKSYFARRTHVHRTWANFSQEAEVECGEWQNPRLILANFCNFANFI